jgi:hypothetical protein
MVNLAPMPAAGANPLFRPSGRRHADSHFSQGDGEKACRSSPAHHASTLPDQPRQSASGPGGVSR